MPCAEPMVRPGSVSGMLTVEQAISASALVVPSFVALPDCSQGNTFAISVPGGPDSARQAQRRQKS